MLKNYNMSFAPLSAMAAGLVIVYTILPNLSELIRLFKSISDLGKGLDSYFEALAKIVIIALTGEFAAQLCSDAGENYLSAKIYFASKIIMICQISPMFIRFIKTVITMVQEL